MGNYDRSQPGYFYRNMHMIADSDEGEPQDISEGGGAGHLMSPWEAMDLSFGEIRQLISDSLGGKLQNVTEKLDGQNIMMTVKT
jgi:predicted mannosyl-3-phosphoglycerate phosphatase (HAD superfamily)